MGPKKRKQPDNNDTDTEESEDDVCMVCQRPFPSVLRHLARSKTDCLEKYNQKEYSLLKEKSAQKSRFKKQKIKATTDFSKKEKNQQYQRNYYQKNKEKLAAKMAERYQQNKALIAQKYANNKEAKEKKLTSRERIHNFRRDIIHGPNYVCSSCKRSLFKASVKCLGHESIKR